MAKDSIKDRIKITKNGKTLHRKKGQAHCKSSKNNPQKGRKKGMREMDIHENKIKELMNQ